MEKEWEKREGDRERKKVREGDRLEGKRKIYIYIEREKHNARAGDRGRERWRDRR